MNNPFAQAVAQHFYDVHYGGNWTDVCLQDVLKDLSYEQAQTRTGDTNSISLLLYHMMFYNQVVFDGTFGEKKHFEHEESVQSNVQNGSDWQKLKDDYFALVQKIYQHILNLSDDQLLVTRPGNHSTNYKNLHGMIEHIHYHLGQISLLRKLSMTSI